MPIFDASGQCPSSASRFAAQRDAREHPQQPRRGVHLDALDDTVRGPGGEVQRERAELPRLRRDRPRRRTPGVNPGGLAQPSTSKNEDGVASGVPAIEQPFGRDARRAPRREVRRRDRRPAHRGVVERRARTTVQMDLQFAERRLRVLQELRRQLPRRGVRLDVTRAP